MGTAINNLQTSFWHISWMIQWHLEYAHKMYSLIQGDYPCYSLWIYIRFSVMQLYNDVYCWKRCVSKMKLNRITAEIYNKQSVNWHAVGNWNRHSLYYQGIYYGALGWYKWHWKNTKNVSLESQYPITCIKLRNYMQFISLEGIREMQYMDDLLHLIALYWLISTEEGRGILTVKINMDCTKIIIVTVLLFIGMEIYLLSYCYSYCFYMAQHNRKNTHKYAYIFC